MKSFEFDLELPAPLDFAASLQIFRRSGDDMLDRWDGKWLVRIASEGPHVFPYACQAGANIDAPVLRVMVRDRAARGVVERTIKAAFLPLVDFEHVCAIDPLIAHLARQHRGFRPVLQAHLLTALIRCISAQQVNLKWASTVRRRLAETFGRRHRVGEHIVYSLDAERLASLQIADIRALQFTTRKAEYVINAARAVADGELNMSCSTMPSPGRKLDAVSPVPRTESKLNSEKIRASNGVRTNLQLHQEARRRPAS